MLFMVILVTGANGYLGQGIVKRLLDDNNIVVATDCKATSIDKRAIIKECDLFDVEDPYTFFERPDVVLHLAWRNGFVHDSETHIGDLKNHCDFMQKMMESGIKKMAVMGTMHEVGFYEGSIDERTPCNPQTPYGIAKNALRHFAFYLEKKTGVLVQWMRGFYMVGNLEFGKSIFSKIAFAEKQGQASFPFTSGINQYDFLDYDDFCYQVAATVEQNTINGIINICSGRPQTIAERAEKFISDNKFKIRLDYGRYPDRPYDSKAVWGNNEKILKILKERGN